MNQTKVFVLYTGGTIGMAPDPDLPGSPLVPQPLAKLKEYAPILGPHIDDPDSLDIAFGEGSFEEPLDSSALNPSHWIKMADMIADVYDEYDGFVILHGTDTMAYTSSALSFMFENLAKPVVITGSQLPISAQRTDAVMNLVNAVHVAGYKASGLPRIPEVVIVFANKILRGCRASKVSSLSWAGFDSPNFPALGNIGEHIQIRRDLLMPPPAPAQRFRVSRDMPNEVMDVSLFPGMKPEHIEQILGLKGVNAIILRTFGAGNAPETADFLEVIETMVANGKTILNVSQCVEGMVEMGLYAASSGLLERGVISGLDMTPEAALAKLMWTLGTTLPQQAQIQMQVNQRGEQSENLFDLRYGGTEGLTDEPVSQFVTPDSRLEVNRISRAVVRITQLRLSGVDKGQETTLRVFVNMPRANSETPDNEPRCVAKLSAAWDGKSPVNLIHAIEQEKTMSVITEGDIVLTVVAEEGVSIQYDKLFLAVFAKARF